MSGKAAEGAPSQETCPERRHSRVGSSLLPLETGGMRKAFIIFFFAVGRLFAQESPADSVASDSGKVREPVLEARVVSGVQPG